MILEWNILHRVDSLISLRVYTQFLSHSRAVMALDHIRLGVENKFLQNKSGRIFCVRQVYFTKSWQQTFYTFYTSHLRWNSVMRRCIYHTNLGKNAKSHNYSRQIALIQYSGPSIVAFLRNRSKNFQNHPVYGQPVLTFDKRQICSSARGSRVFEWTSKELRFNIENSLCLFFIQWFYNDV